MIWFCMQIWDKVRIINQTRAVFSSTKEEKENRYYFCFYKKKIESYFCQSLYCNSLPKNQIKSFLLSLHWQILFNTRNIQFACKMLRMSQVSSSTSAFLSISSDLGQLANCYLGCSTSIFWCISILIISEYWKVVTSHFPPYSCFAIETDCLWESVWCIFSIILLPMKITIFIKPIYVWNFLFTKTI